MSELTCLEICAGAGGQSRGLELAGFDHVAALEIDADAAETLRQNRPTWNVLQGDVRNLDGAHFHGIDLLAGGVPCPPFSVAGGRLGAADERDLFPEALRLVREAGPAAVMLENVKGLAERKFGSYRQAVIGELERLGYEIHWQVLNACEFGVPQLRPRFVLVAIKRRYAAHFTWPTPTNKPSTVGEVLYPLMAANGWPGARAWAQRANDIAPTIVGGSRKHGGPDLGPTRARADWLRLGVEGRSIAETAPPANAPGDYLPRLTCEMVALIQGFDDDWTFVGRKTSKYRQIGNAFPPPVAQAIGAQIKRALDGARSEPLRLVRAG
ncbi:MAG TPA: DNA cytosine methyltransferase [Streptosporangiaceae bacterium]|nr:DNA cytosine methyltransferase [Streptosporangiaceae bacterium]